MVDFKCMDTYKIPNVNFVCKCLPSVFMAFICFITSTNNFFAAKDYGILDYDVVKESGGKTTVYDLHHTEVPPRSGH